MLKPKKELKKRKSRLRQLITTSRRGTLPKFSIRRGKIMNQKGAFGKQGEES